MGDKNTAAKARYNKTAYDFINLSVKKGRKELIQKRALANGESVNGYLNRLIEEDLSN
jgi:hypothetical protein